MMPLKLYNITDKLNFLEVQSYLSNTGWQRRKSKRDYIAIFINKVNKDVYEIVLPLDKDIADYGKAMYDVVNELSKFENREIDQVINDLSNPLADTIRFRVSSIDTQNGTIPLNEGFSLFESAKKMLLSAACDIIQPEFYHKRLSLKAAQQFIEQCRLGQTEHGSFVTSIICPFINQSFDDIPNQLTFFDETSECANSLTRKVTTRLMESIKFIKDSIDQNELSKLEKQNDDLLISANFLESIVDMNLNKKNTEIEIMTTWSSCVPQQKELPTKIKLTHHYVPALEKVISKVRRSDKEDFGEFIGKISQTRAEVDPLKRTEGEIIFNFMQDEDKISKAKVILTSEDYSKACIAHNLGKTVLIKGKLTGTTRTTVIEQPHFKVIEE